MWRCAPGVTLVDLFCFVRVIVLDLVNICNIQLVSHIAQKVIDLESWNFTGFVISMCNCAPGYFRVDLFSICKVIALDLIKICNFQFVSHEAQKVFEIGSWNFTEMFISMCCCAPWISLVDFSSICRVIALELVKPVSSCYVICSLSAWVRTNKLYRKYDQSQWIHAPGILHVDYFFIYCP
jgi:hypothetical protein